jgi:hypothetical protein
MVKKKTNKKAPPKKKKTPSWEKIGQEIGKKIEAESKGNKCKTWSYFNTNKKDDGGFFGRALFILGMLLLLNHVGITEGVSIWIQLLIGFGFALMRF